MELTRTNKAGRNPNFGPALKKRGWARTLLDGMVGVVESKKACDGRDGFERNSAGFERNKLIARTLLR